MSSEFEKILRKVLDEKLSALTEHLDRTIDAMTTRQWIPAREAALMIGCSLKYLNEKKDEWGLIYFQKRKNCAIRYKLTSILKYIQKNNNQ